MPRGVSVRYFIDDKSGRMIIIDRGEIREMREIGGKAKRGRKGGDPMAPAEPGGDGQPKKRGRPRKKPAA